jgi:hypothetical protein
MSTLIVTINDGIQYKKLALDGNWVQDKNCWTFVLDTPLRLCTNEYVLRDHNDFRIDYDLKEAIKFNIDDDNDDVFVFEFYSDSVVEELEAQEEEE